MSHLTTKLSCDIINPMMITDPVPSELTGRAVHLSGHGDYAGREWPGVIQAVGKRDLQVMFRDPFTADPVTELFDRISGWPHDPEWRVNGFRVRGPEVQFLLREEEGRLSYPQLDAAERHRSTMSATQAPEAPANTETAPASAEATSPPAAPTGKMRVLEGHQICDLEGFGKNSGRVVQAVVVEKTEDNVLLAIPQEGKDPIKKTFMLKDGKMEGNTGANGWKICDAHLAELSGRDGKKAGKNGSASPPKTKAPKEAKFCLCGCGAQVQSRFVTGHDATAHSMIKKGLRGLLSKDDLKGRDWVIDQIELQGGFNTQEAPASAKRRSGGETESMVNPTTGKTLYGAAARALKDKLAAAEKETVQPASA